MSYSRDPMWIKARFGSACGCGARVGKGQRVFYYPLQKQTLCVKCSEAAAADFELHRQDEESMTALFR